MDGRTEAIALPTVLMRSVIMQDGNLLFDWTIWSKSIFIHCITLHLSTKVLGKTYNKWKKLCQPTTVTKPKFSHQTQSNQSQSRDGSNPLPCLGHHRLDEGPNSPTRRGTFEERWRRDFPMCFHLIAVWRRCCTAAMRPIAKLLWTLVFISFWLADILLSLLVYRVRLKNTPTLQKSHYFQNNLIFFGEIFRGYSWDVFFINAANFSISTLVLQKKHSFKHKRRFSQVHKENSDQNRFTHKF